MCEFGDVKVLHVLCRTGVLKSPMAPRRLEEVTLDPEHCSYQILDAT